MVFPTFMPESCFPSSSLYAVIPLTLYEVAVPSMPTVMLLVAPAMMYAILA